MEKEIYGEIDAVQRGHWWFESRRRIIESVIKKHIPSEKKFSSVLDIGCGPGINVEMLRKLSDRVQGLDNAEDAIRLVEKHDSHFPISKGEFPFWESDSHYDLITALDVLEHVEDDERGLRKIEELLLPGGVAVITVPAFGFLWTKHDERLHHYRRYTVGELRGKVRASTSLRVDKISYFNFFLFLPILLFRWFKRIVHSDHVSDFFIPPKFMNAGLAKIFSLETLLVPFVALPFGVSIICILKKAGYSDKI